MMISITIPVDTSNPLFVLLWQMSRIPLSNGLQFLGYLLYFVLDSGYHAMWEYQQTYVFRWKIIDRVLWRGVIMGVIIALVIYVNPTQPFTLLDLLFTYTLFLGIEVLFVVLRGIFPSMRPKDTIIRLTPHSSVQLSKELEVPAIILRGDEGVSIMTDHELVFVRNVPYTPHVSDATVHWYPDGKNGFTSQPVHKVVMVTPLHTDIRYSMSGHLYETMDWPDDEMEVREEDLFNRWCDDREHDESEVAIILHAQSSAPITFTPPPTTQPSDDDAPAMPVVIESDPVEVK